MRCVAVGSRHDDGARQVALPRPGRSAPSRRRGSMGVARSEAPRVAENIKRGPASDSAPVRARRNRNSSYFRRCSTPPSPEQLGGSQACAHLVAPALPRTHHAENCADGRQGDAGDGAGPGPHGDARPGQLGLPREDLPAPSSHEPLRPAPADPRQRVRRAERDGHRERERHGQREHLVRRRRARRPEPHPDRGLHEHRRPVCVDTSLTTTALAAAHTAAPRAAPAPATATLTASAAAALAATALAPTATAPASSAHLRRSRALVMWRRRRSRLVVRARGCGRRRAQ